MSFTVTIGGSTVDGLIEVDYAGAGTTKLGTAEIQAKNTSANRSYSYGDEVVVQRDGTTEWTGYLEDKSPTGDRNLKVTLKARDKREELQFVEVHRPFYNMDSGAVVRAMVNEEVQPRSPVLVHTGDDLTNWTSDIPEFELADITGAKLNDYGQDLLFCYWREGATGSFEATFSNVPTRIDNGRLLWFEDRFLFNNAGGFFSGEVELRDHAGNSYVWDMEIPESPEFAGGRYPAEEADPNGELSSDGTLQYRIEIDGSLPEARGAVLDYARGRPFATTNRGTGITTADVQTTERDIVRRFDSSVFEAIAQLATEDGAISFVDAEDDLHYEPSGDTDAPESITYGGTRVTNIEPNRDASSIVNQVVAQGAGDLQVSRKSSSSISFYGVSAREKPLVNKQIQNERELRDYADGYLSDNAWNDTDVTFTIADGAYRNVRVGQSIYVKWGPEDLDQFMTVSETNTDSAGRVEIGVTGSSA